MERKPKPDDFKVGEPITNAERMEALDKILNERVKEDREAAYNKAYDEWVWNNSENR